MTTPASMTDTVSVSRCSRTPVNGVVAGTWAQVFASVRCRVELLKSYQKDSMIGRIDGAQYRMTWISGEAVHNGDRVVWDGDTYLVEDVGKDKAIAWRAQQICILREVK